MDIRITSCGEPLADHLEQFKQYASIPDNSRDGILLKILKTAMLRVQEFTDVAVLPTTIEMVVNDVRRGDVVRLYQGGTSVTSIVNQDGEVVDYEQEGNRLRILDSCLAMTVTYTCVPVVARAETLQPVIWQLATAIYDGEDAKAQAAILRSSYGPR